ncbi:MAG: FAD-binding protein [Jatrophihabitans sp.]|uniref:FAD-binding protein n=1 Tax=Jatrophihabitans sp. TaxID=1932789 RepID=UPI003911CD7D
MQLQNWAGNITFTPDRLHTPRRVDELQHLVASTDRIRALGTGHSFNRIADTVGALVSLRDLGANIEIDATANTVTVPAGARYGEVGSVLQRQGLALHNLGSLPHISVAGACATGTHGSGVGNRCLAAAAVGIEFVRADGELVQVRPADPAYAGSVVALGALGIVTRITLAVEPTFDVRQDVFLDAPLDTVLDDLDAVLASGYSVSLFTDWSRPDVIDKIWVKSRDGEAPDGRRWGARPADVAQHPIAGEDPAAATEQFGRPGPWNARLPHFRLEFTPSSGEEQQSEYLVAHEHGADAIRAVHELDLAGVAQVAEFRTIAADGLWLSPFHERASVGLHFTWIDDDAAVHAAVSAVEQALTPFDPRPHWGKVFLAAPSAVRAHYSRLADFQSLAATHDPDRKFGNDFLERFVY